MKLLRPLFRRVRRSPGAGYDTPAAPPRPLLRGVTDLAVAVPALLVAILAAFSLFPLQPARAAGPTAVPGGTLAASTTWTRAGSPYLVGSVTDPWGVTLTSLNVPSGVTLTIEPGTEVRFGTADTNGYINVQSGGTFIAQGLVTQPITLTSGNATPRPGDWASIFVAAGGRMRLRYCDVSYGGSSSGSLAIQSSDVEVRDCSVRDGGGYGIHLAKAGIEPVFENVTLTGNLKAGAYYEGISAPRYRNVTIAGNGTDAVVISNGGVAVDTTLDGTGLNGRPFVFTGTNLTVLPRSALTVAAGTEIRFITNTGIVVDTNGRFVAEGTPAQPITLTSAEAVPRAGDWNFFVDYSGTARLAYCDLRYGGRGSLGSPGASLRSTEGDVQVRNCRIRDGAGDGIQLYDNYHYKSKAVLESVAITGHRGAAVRQWANADVTYRGLSASGNGVDAVVLDTSTTVASRTRLGPAGIPYRVDGTLQVNGGALVLEPGTDVRFSPAGTIDAYRGILQVTGSVSQPVTLTAVSGVAGGWRGVRIAEGASAMLQYCDLSYGGASGQALLEIASNNTVVENCRIRGSAGDGIRVSYHRPVIDHNQIFSNTVGLSVTGVVNWGATPQVDARSNWWGDPSGPSGAPSNPSGKGDRIGPGVQFDPWLRAPGAGSAIPGQLVLDVAGPRFVSPGQTVDYLIGYANRLSRTVESAVIVFTLPLDAAYEGSTDDGIFWPERQQVFWRLGNLSPGASGAVSVRARYFWGLPEDLPIEALAILVGSNAGESAFDVAAYQNYAARTVVSTVQLTEDQISRERQSSADYDTLYRDATAAGFLAAGAGRLTYNDGSVVTQTILISRKGTVLLRRKGTDVQSIYVDATSYAVRSTTGGVTTSLEAGTVETWGDWKPGASGAAAGTIDATATEISESTCLKNCLMKTVGGAIPGKVSKAIEVAKNLPGCAKGLLGDKTELANCAIQLQDKIPGLGDAVDLLKCGPDCDDPKTRDKWACTGPLKNCVKEFSWLIPQTWAGGTKKAYRVYECKDGVWDDVPRYLKCNGTGESCVEGFRDEDGRPCVGCGESASSDSAALSAEEPGSGGASVLSGEDICAALAEAGGTCKSNRGTVSQAHDPNALYGPSGDLLPGQWITYTITYENEGAGQAYGVYVTDELPQAFDASTVTAYGSGSFISTTRTIFWEVGELTPMGQTGSTGVVSFTARLRSDLPGGTAVKNRAVVFFPSVPEETPTNPVVNVIRPLVAIPKSLQTRAATAISVPLEGLDVGNAPLTYTIVTRPLGGALTGSLTGSSGAGLVSVAAVRAAAGPSLTYTPDPTFSGADSFTYKVSNGITESQSATIEIVVEAPATDTTAPEVRWTEPSSGASVKPSVTAVQTDTLGSVYAPSVQIQFSEAISTTTLTTETVRLVDGSGRLVTITVGYDPTVNRAVAMPRVPWRTGTYTVTLTSRIADASGNRLASEYSWSFRAEVAPRLIYLPIVVNALTVGW